MLHTKRNLRTRRERSPASCSWRKPAGHDKDPVQLNKQANKRKHKQSQVSEGNRKNPCAPLPYFTFSPTLYVCWEHFKADTMYEILNTVFNCPWALKLPLEGTEPQKCTECIEYQRVKAAWGCTLSQIHADFFLADLHERETFQLTA